jgi:tetratricopeptide (TPR) repeat protein
LEQLKIVCETAPRSFDDVLPAGTRVDGDLETITSTALAKDADVRYQSVASLGDDLERYLASQPILARPQSTTYQIRKLIARNKLPASLIGGIFALVLGFGIGMSILYTRADSSLRRALVAEGEATQASDFMVEIFDINDPSEARGNTITAKEILDRGADRIDTELAEQPAIHSRMLRTMGRVYRGLGLYDRADSMLTAALARYSELGPAARGTEEEADILDDMGRMHLLIGRFEEAEKCFSEAVAIKEVLFGRDGAKVAGSLVNLGRVYFSQARLDTARIVYLRARQNLGASESAPEAYAAILNGLGQIQHAEGNFAAAETLFTRSLVIRREVLPENHPEVARGLNNLAMTLQVQGHWSAAADLVEEAIAIRRYVLGPNHPDVGRLLLNQAILFKDLGRLDEAESRLEQALIIQETALSPDHLDVSATLNSLGRLYHRQGKFKEGNVTLERCLRIRQEKLGADHPSVSYPVNSLGEIALDQQRFGRADSMFTRALAIREAAYGPDNPRTALIVHNLGRLRLAEGRLRAAEPLLLRGLKIREDTLGPVHYRIAESLDVCAQLYYAMSNETNGTDFDTRAAKMWDSINKE